MEEELESVKIENQQNDTYLEIEKLVTRFFTSKGIVKALDGVSLKIRKGEIYGLVGESGCGKSVTASSVMDLIPDPPGRIISGKIVVDGFNILSDLEKLATFEPSKNNGVKIKRNKKEIKRHEAMMSRIRGKKMAMIFQEPSLSLNPIKSVGFQIEEAILLHSIAEIADSIIRVREIDGQTVMDALSRFQAIEDPTEKHTEIRKWCRSYGVAAISDNVFEAVKAGTDPTTIAEEVLGTIQDNYSDLDDDAVLTVRDYYITLNHLGDLERRLIQADADEDFDLADELREKIEDIRSYVRSEFGILPILMKFFKKKYHEPFRKAAADRTIEMLEMVNIPEPERIYKSYPHELSGGMQQRIMIAMALSTNPSLLIADEPTTALDVTTQAQILTLMKDLREITGSSILFITHDLAVIAEMCDRVGVMYGGNVVEEASVESLFYDPKHPYTVGLLSSMPKEAKEAESRSKLSTIPGTVPNLIHPPTGCRFNPRCSYAMDICKTDKPKLVEIEKGHKVACFVYSNEVETSE